MAKKIQRVNIIDLECTCWENQETPDGKPQRDNMEIIEIGIVQVNVRELKIIKEKSYMVIPIEYPVSDYCTNLTGITSDMLMKDGVTLKLAIAQMMTDFSTKKYEWFSWGEFDKLQFKNECEKKGLEYPVSYMHSNIKYWLSKITGHTVQRNVAGMMSFLNLKFDGRAHRGVDDARNIARMYIEVMKQIREISHENIVNKNWGDNFQQNIFING